MKRDLMDTGGVTHGSCLPKLTSGMRKTGYQSPDISRPGVSPTKKESLSNTNPASPLDWPGTPTQPLKKMKRGILEQIKEVRLMVAAEDKRMLANSCCGSSAL